jgi:hypothetical protein
MAANVIVSAHWELTRCISWLTRFAYSVTSRILNARSGATDRATSYSSPYGVPPIPNPVPGDMVPPLLFGIPAGSSSPNCPEVILKNHRRYPVSHSSGNQSELLYYILCTLVMLVENHVQICMIKQESPDFLFCCEGRRPGLCRYGVCPCLTAFSP